MDEVMTKKDLDTLVDRLIGYPAAFDAFARLVNACNLANRRADRAEAELARMTAEIHPAVQAAPPVRVPLADIGDSRKD